MSKPVVTIHPNASLQDALQTMQARGILRPLVVSDDGNNIAGILTNEDIFKFIARNESVSSSIVSNEVFAKNKEWLNASILTCLMISYTRNNKVSKGKRNTQLFKKMPISISSI